MVLPEKVRRGWEIGNVAIRKAKLQGIVRSYIQDTADCFPKMAVTMAFPSHKDKMSLSLQHGGGIYSCPFGFSWASDCTVEARLYNYTMGVTKGDSLKYSL